MHVKGLDIWKPTTRLEIEKPSKQTALPALLSQVKWYEIHHAVIIDLQDGSTDINIGYLTEKNIRKQMEKMKHMKDISMLICTKK
jgi:hypothetical protein